MTVEELKKEAEKLGCSIQKKAPKMLQCTCGNNTRHRWYVNGKTILECTNCHVRAEGGVNELEARNNWNDMIKEKTNERALRERNIILW